MRTISSLRLLFAAVIACLEDAGLLVGQGAAEGLPLPYVVAYPMPSGRQDGNMADPYCVEPYVVQVDCWGETVEQATWGADTARVALFAGITPPAGWSVMHIAEDVGGGVVRDDDTAGPPAWRAINRYRIWVTPSGSS